MSAEPTDLQKLKQEARDWPNVRYSAPAYLDLIRRLLDVIEGLEKEVALVKENGMKAVSGLGSAILQGREALTEERQKVENLREALTKLVVFTTELCEDIKVSTHYPSLANAREVLDQL